MFYKVLVVFRVAIRQYIRNLRSVRVRLNLLKGTESE